MGDIGAQQAHYEVLAIGTASEVLATMPDPDPMPLPDPEPTPGPGPEPVPTPPSDLSR